MEVLMMESTIETYNMELERVLYQMAAIIRVSGKIINITAMGYILTSKEKCILASFLRIKGMAKELSLINHLALNVMVYGKMMLK